MSKATEAAYQKTWRAAHKTENAEKEKAWREANNERVRLKDKQRKARNAARSRARYAANREPLLAKNKAYRAANKDPLKRAAMDAYGGVCAHCGYSDLRALCIDHVDGGGRKHRAAIKIGGGESFYRWLRRNGYPSGFQVLCANCNLIKAVAGEMVGPPGWQAPVTIHVPQTEMFLSLNGGPLV